MKGVSVNHTHTEIKNSQGQAANGGKQFGTTSSSSFSTSLFLPPSSHLPWEWLNLRGDKSQGNLSPGTIRINGTQMMPGRSARQEPFKPFKLSNCLRAFSKSSDHQARRRVGVGGRSGTGPWGEHVCEGSDA